MPRRKAAAYGRGRVVENQARGRWEAVVYIHGRRVVRTAPTEREAWAKLDELNERKRAGVQPSRQTLRQYMDAWIELRRLKPTTRATYESLMRKHVYPVLGDTRLDRVTGYDLAQLIGSIRRAASTVRQIRAILHAALGDAALQKLITENPVKLTRGVRRSKRKMPRLDDESLARFLDETRDDDLGALYLLAATYGLRRGELLALHWRDIDLRTGTLHVRGGMTRVQRETHFGTTKSDEERTVPIPPPLVEVLGAWHQRQAAAYRELGVTPERDLVFTRADGVPLVPSTVTKTFQARLRGLGLPVVRLHSLRRSAVSSMLEAGLTVREVMDVVGHSTSRMTLEVYADSTPETVRAKILKAFPATPATSSATSPRDADGEKPESLAT